MNISILNNRNHLCIAHEEFSLAIRTYADLTEHYALTDEIWTHFFIDAICSLMHEYKEDSRENRQFPLVYDGIFVSQKQFFDEVIQACRDLSTVMSETNYSAVSMKQMYKNKIKFYLEKGLFANTPDSQDNFPKIVKAIANYTENLKDWEFSSGAVERLNHVENLNEARNLVP